MNLKPRKETIVGQKEFLRNSVGLQFKTAGATLDGDAFADVAVDGYIKAGTAVCKGPEGLYVPWSDPKTDEDGNTEVREGAGLVAHDTKLISGSNPITGILAAGHPLEKKCIGVTDAFKEATKGRLVFDI